jgi:NAD(P)-dependent dehydrogenase (short-subunit alcohol dehydrogenase family)
MSETKGLVIVTGGSRGIGTAICRRLATDGYVVAVNYATQPAAAEAVVAEIKGAGGSGDLAPAAEAGSVRHRCPVLPDRRRHAFGPRRLRQSEAQTGRVPECKSRAGGHVQPYDLNSSGLPASATLPGLLRRSGARLWLADRHGPLTEL